MSTKLSAFCDKVIEAGWLMALVIAPLFFNPYSYRSFEPDKIALLRSIALVMILAWAVKILETGRELWNLRKTKLTPDLWIFRTPLAIPALLLVGVYILTTITSIAPRISLWGSYHRLQGTYTTLSYIVIFFLTLQGLHTREQVDRLITVILVTSLPVSLYGIMQHYGLDPITWKASEEVTFRAISTMGNPIFVAAYLIMVIPLTMGRLIQLFAAVHKGGKKLILIGCYIFLLVAQLLCILFTQSRGPLLGLMGGMFFFLLLLAASTGEKKLALAAIGAAILLGLLLAALNLPNSPLESIKGVPYLGRLSGVFDIQSRTGRQRILAWEGVVNLVTADPLRAIIGYGPESLMLAFHRYFPPDLVPLMPNATFDRSHNETLDALATTGLIGFIAYLLLFGSLVYYGLRSLGLIESSRYQRIFILLEITGGLAGALLPRLLEGKWRFAGIGIPAGLIMALGIYLAIRVLLYPQERGSSEGRYSSISLIALLSAVVAHFIEIQLGIAIAATRTYFWIYSALTIAIGFFLQERPSLECALATTFPNRRGRRRKKGPGGQKQITPRRYSTASGGWNTSLVPYSLIAGLILATLGFAFINYQVNPQGQAFALGGLFLTVWLISGLVAVAESSEEVRPGRNNPLEGAYLSYTLLSLGWFFLLILVGIFSTQVDSDVANSIVVYCLYLFLSLIVLAFVLLKKTALPTPSWQRAKWWLYLLLIASVIVFAIKTNLNPIKADIYYKQGLAYANGGQWDASIALFRQALKLAPDQDFYCLFLAGACVEKAKAASDVAQASTWFEEGRRALERGRQINPLNPDHIAKLGLLYRAWGEMLTEPREKAEKLDVALGYYKQALALSPHNAGILREWGSVYYIKGKYDKAIEKYQQSLSLDRRSSQTYLLLGDAYMAKKELDRAFEAYENAVKFNPKDFIGHKKLAFVYQQRGQIDKAIAEAKIAKNLAPPYEKPALENFITRCEAEKP